MNEIVQLFRDASFWRKYSNRFDMVFDCNLSEGDKADLRMNFLIPLEETILFARDTSFWDSRNQGLVITDGGFYHLPDNDNPNALFKLGWGEFNKVKYQELVFYFYLDSKLVERIGRDLLFKEIEDREVIKISDEMCTLFQRASSLFTPPKTGLDYLSDGNYDLAYEWANNDLIQNSDSPLPYFVKAQAIYLKESDKTETKDLNEQALLEALDLFTEAISRLDPEIDRESVGVVYTNQAAIYELLGQPYTARDQYVMALDGASDDKERRNLMSRIDSLEKNDLSHIWSNYIDVYEYKDRKFIMPLRESEIGGCFSPNIGVFRVNNIPTCVSFPIGHPIPSQVYIGHPYKSSLYVPFEESEEMFFVDKVNELCYLLECLGAEEISIFSEKGRSVEEMSNHSRQVSGSGDIKAISTNGNLSQGHHMNSSLGSISSRGTTIKLDPLRYPYLPDDLVWYSGQPDWQRLVDRRLSNNILEYKEFLSTSQTSFVNSIEKAELLVAAQYLWAKANTNVKTNTETQFKEAIDTQWRVEVKFRSLKFFEQSDTEQIIVTSEISSSLSKAEEAYIDEINFCLEEGELTEKDLKYLERMRGKLGISPQRAEELIKVCRGTLLSEAENEYVEAYREELGDGEISPRTRRLLDRLSSSLGISEDRAKQLEKLV